MKIQVEVLGVEQAVDFNTMETKAFVVLEVFGQIVRAPVSEQQMEQLTLAAVHHRQLATGQAFEETREKSAEAPVFEGPVETTDREFSVMSELTDRAQQEDTPGMEGLFDSEEQQKIEKLRARPPLALPQHAPTNTQMPSLGLPRPPAGDVDEDGFTPG